jgi:uncharacterized membrane protein YfcA
MNSEMTMIVAVLAVGFAAGILSGMFGIGGGLVIVPALVFLFHMPFKTATGTSLFALLWPVGLLGVVEYWKDGHLKPWHGAGIAAGLFVGAYLGARITLTISDATMRRLYAIFLLVVGTYILISTRTGSEGISAKGPLSGSPLSAAGDGAAQVH